MLINHNNAFYFSTILVGACQPTSLVTATCAMKVLNKIVICGLNINNVTGYFYFFIFNI